MILLEAKTRLDRFAQFFNFQSRSPSTQMQDPAATATTTAAIIIIIIAAVGAAVAAALYRTLGAAIVFIAGETAAGRPPTIDEV